MYIHNSLDHFSPFAYPVFGHPIAKNPLSNNNFILKEYNNWNTVSPKFTYKEYIEFKKIYNRYNTKKKKNKNT